MAEGRANKTGLADAVPTEALKEAGQQLISLFVQRATDVASQRVSGLADRLTDVTASGGDIRAVSNGGGARDDRDDGGQDGRTGGIAGALSGLKEKAKNLLGGGGGGSGGAKKLKMTTIIEELDIGLPLRTTYDLWTQFADFPSFMKKVETVEQETDEKTNWTAKVFWSRRTWEATVLEQVPDSHIVWRSTGVKGHVDGAVSFTGVGPNLTRVLLVMEYWPKGFFEHTGNLWRAQGRRARLEFKHFRRHAMSNVILRQQDVEGWRGEIRDSEVVKTHEDAVAEERAREEEPSPDASEVQDRSVGVGPGEPIASEPDEDADGDAVRSASVEDDERDNDEDFGDEDSGDEDSGEEDLGEEDLGEEDLGEEDLGEEDLGDEDAGDEDSGDEEYGDEDDGEVDDAADEADEADDYGDEADDDDADEAEDYDDSADETDDYDDDYDDDDSADEADEPAPVKSGSRR
jgi:Polyketide cyclase / dehydrase and lipid transport